jgi:hypothetical protein
MPNRVNASFATRREAELAVEHLVQEHRIDRQAITVRAEGDENTAGTRAAGADVEKDADPALAGRIAVSVICSANQRPVIEGALREVGGR